MLTRGFSVPELDNDHAEISFGAVRCRQRGRNRIEIRALAESGHEAGKFGLCVVVDGASGSVGYRDTRPNRSGTSARRAMSGQLGHRAVCRAAAAGFALAAPAVVSAACNLSSPALHGAWTRTGSTGCFEEMEFSSEGTRYIFSSWLHHRNGSYLRRRVAGEPRSA